MMHAAGLTKILFLFCVRAATYLRLEFGFADSGRGLLEEQRSGAASPLVLCGGASLLLQDAMEVDQAGRAETQLA